MADFDFSKITTGQALLDRAMELEAKIGATPKGADRTALQNEREALFRFGAGGNVSGIFQNNKEITKDNPYTVKKGGNQVAYNAAFAAPNVTTSPAPAPLVPAPTPTIDAPAPAPEPVPPTIWSIQPEEVSASVVKSAPIDTVIFTDSALSDQLMVDLLFEDIGGQELLTIARTDTVNGQEVSYQPIKNLSILQQAYNITDLLSLQETSDKFFENFMIRLSNRVPNIGNGLNGKNYYQDEVTGDLVIEFVNLKDEERIEVQISKTGIIDEAGI
jgi:hypothetical protein